MQIYFQCRKKLEVIISRREKDTLLQKSKAINDNYSETKEYSETEFLQSLTKKQ